MLEQKWGIINLVVLLFLYIHTDPSCGQETFNCRRLNSCDNGGTCNPETGLCTCVAGFKGYKCHIVDGAPCANTTYCGENGECYVEGEENKCGCNVGFFGSLCERQRVETKCDGSGMEVTFNILTPNFAGKVAAINSADGGTVSLPDVCTFTADPNDATISTMTVKVGTSTGDANVTECVTSQFTETTDPATGKKTTAQFRILYLPQYVTSGLDLGYTVRCDLNKDDLKVYSEVTNVELSQQIPNVDVNATYSPVMMRVVKENDEPIGEIINIGDKLKLLFYLTDNTVYKAMTVVSITTNNTLEGNASKTFVVVNSGCPTVHGQQVAGSQTEVTDTDGKPGKAIVLSAFKFIDTAKVGLVASVAVCETVDDTKCKPPTDCEAVRQSEGTSGAGGGNTTTGGDTSGTGGDTSGTGGDTSGTGGDTSGTGGDTSGTGGDMSGTGGDTSGTGGGTNTTNTNGTDTNTGTNGTNTNTDGTNTNTEGTNTETDGTNTASNGTNTETDGTNTNTNGTSTASNGTNTETDGTNTDPDGANTPSNETNTAIDETDPDAPARKRKRRATSDTEQVVSTVLNVQGPESLTTAAAKATPTDDIEKCFTQTEILAAIIVLGSTVCVLFIVSAILCCLLLKRRESKSSFGSLSSKKLSDRFHIPRASSHIPRPEVNEAFTTL